MYLLEIDNKSHICSISFDVVYIIVFGNFLGYHYVDSLVIIFISTVLPLIPAAMLNGIINSLNKVFIIIIFIIKLWTLLKSCQFR